MESPNAPATSREWRIRGILGTGRVFFDRTGPAGLVFQPDRTGRFGDRIQPAENQSV